MLMNEKEKFYSLYPEMDYDSLFEKIKTDKDFVNNFMSNVKGEKE